MCIDCDFSSLHIVDRECAEPAASSPAPPPTTFNSNWTNESYGFDSGGGGGVDDASASNGDDCKCNYLSFVEPPFDALSLHAGRRICNDNYHHQQQPANAAVYTGHTRSLMLHFSLAHTAAEDAFNLTMVAERESASPLIE